MAEGLTDGHRKFWRGIIVIPTLLAATVVLIVGFLLDRQNAEITDGQQRAHVLSELSVLRAKLEGNVTSNIQLVRGLVATISTEPDMDQARFEALVSNIFQEDSQLRSIAAAPDLVISMTYPLKGNEAAIGLDYRSTPAQWQSVRWVLESGKLNIAGPVDLVQGGQGFVGRFPVYANRGEGNQFWGIIAAVVDVERLYVDSGLRDPDLDIEVSISGKDGAGSIGGRFFGPDLSADNPVLAEVALPSGTWQLAAAPKAGWGANPVYLWATRALIALGGGLILLPIVVTAGMIAQRQDHIRELGSREAELRRLTRRLNLAIDVSKVGVWELDLVTDHLVWDDRMNELYGLPADGGARDYTHWRTALHPDDLAQAEIDFTHGIKTGHYQSEFRARHPDGSVRHVRAMGAVFADDGQHPRILGVNWDVSNDVLLRDDLRLAKLQAEARASDLEAARVSIEHNALHDSLTGLPNRRYLDEVLRRHAADGYHGSGSIALLHIDLDRFKQINDTLGHAAGDAMLIHASRILRANCRETDFVARIGGDEFLIVSTAGANNRRLELMAERIVREMRKPTLHEGHEIRFGVSIGVATRRASDIDVRQLLVNADIALYRAKAMGRNRHELFSEALQAEVIHTKRVADEVLKGLEARSFLAHYQPQFDATTLDLVGVEALVRWQHPEQGIKGPDSFLDIAEELNVMAQIDQIVLEQSLSDLKRWDEMGLKVPRVSVNVSLRRLTDEGLVAGLSALHLPAGRVAFELVESIYLDESDGAVAWNIDKIKEMGIDVEIDDFGTGYASIVSLQKLHPKRLKIDRQLVMPILDQPAQRRLVASIVDIGKSMDIEIVAEGVETMEHATILRDLGCDILQGYAFARPMSRQALETFLGEKSRKKAG
ncbi:MAG: EAL domain-containing protein [Devosia sp.]|uniref:bifunctional diguanylate cyclase/phosphodiesterase n=1 Tax=Devosia sp. TaxID=1871048 RepID=UPI0024C6DC24|nr:EAL domain-containing protein [Devosia sp.]UYN99088.1 MAG: EAL domain-containing protein [Devosia sp.]